MIEARVAHFEDSRSFLGFAEDDLTRGGHVVVASLTTLGEAMDYLESDEEFDVALVDGQMPTYDYDDINYAEAGNAIVEKIRLQHQGSKLVLGASSDYRGVKDCDYVVRKNYRQANAIIDVYQPGDEVEAWKNRLDMDNFLWL